MAAIRNATKQLSWVSNDIFGFKQMKQNFPLRYFYGESANAIKIQIWVILIANLLLTVMRKRLKRK